MKRIGDGTPGSSKEHSTGTDEQLARHRLCFKFNQGRCHFGPSCKFEHKCGLCLKWGHGADNCRRVGQDSSEYCERDRYSDDRNGGKGKDKRNDCFDYYRKEGGNKDREKQ